MTLTPQQLAARRNHIGSSDAAAILGMDDYRTPADVLAEKLMELEPDTSSEAAEVGNWLEPLLCQWAAERLGELVVLSPETIVAPCGILAANLDAVQLIDPIADASWYIEAKSTGLADQWGDEGTDQVPERVIVQTAVAFACAPSLRTAYVPVLIGRFGLRRQLYRVERDDELVGTIADRLREWWDAHVVRRVPLDDAVPSMDVLRRIRREPGTWADLPSTDLLDTYIAAREAAKAAEERLDLAKAALINAMGQAEGVRVPGGRTATYLTQARRSLDVEELRRAHPDIAAKYQRTSTHRVLRTPRSTQTP